MPEKKKNELPDSYFALWCGKAVCQTYNMEARTGVWR